MLSDGSLSRWEQLRNPGLAEPELARHLELLA